MKRTIQFTIALLCASTLSLQATWEGLKELMARNKKVIALVAAVDLAAVGFAYASYACKEKATSEEAAKRKKSRLSSSTWKNLSGFSKFCAALTGVYAGTLTLGGMIRSCQKLFEN